MRAFPPHRGSDTKNQIILPIAGSSPLPPYRDAGGSVDMELWEEGSV